MSASTQMRPLPTRRALPPLKATTRHDISSVGSTLGGNLEGEPPPKRDEDRPRTATRRKRQTNRAPEDDRDDGEDSTYVKALHSTSAEESQMSSSTNARGRRRRQRPPDKPHVNTEDMVIANGRTITSIVSQDDVVRVDRLEEGAGGVRGGGAGVRSDPSINRTSQAEAKIFVQTNSGFTSKPNEWLQQRQAALKKQQGLNHEFNLSRDRSNEVALGFQRGWIFLTLLLHGLLAGIAVWQVSTSFFLNSKGDDNFFEQYQVFAQPVQLIFFILLIACFISALDRYDIGENGLQYFASLCQVDSRAWAVFAYFCAFMFTVGMTGLDVWLGTNPPVSVVSVVDTATTTSADVTTTTTAAVATAASPTSDYLNAEPSQNLLTWKVLNVLRMSFAVIGWLLIAFGPIDDNTSRNLFKDEEADASPGPA